ncbi:MAG TPA: tRNA uridine-5-carboxymethylaminomethyl(34) synthesis GTPase MnmE [Candidatus Marinimicrobia bacterium]|nr:tRNA uridine-5-carboxymethylaminomethyl(34) synthesis GTPase MnmE [Candidatus Neomarinimicrobiota bacterium]HRS50849.1 tRNA uridine-5-carboxymethylaminomethyl(34) synthesis GTPase MnmE [Candidatus Neomarinimicrobiota bacterium]HRU91809.1 tRNA uridine-5-carboxymethylaminomethyl(34) synthesis GTPase MnmE [Candidatus Neomarinimicrobiota bacterium]
MASESTIVALSTPPGLGALAVVRLSGPKSPGIVQKLTQTTAQLKPRIAQHVNLYSNDELVDDAVVIYYKAPNSYTGEDLVEISCHGSPFIINKLIELCLAHGARLAQPGEFTRRAFLNGKFNLTQAEAVADLVFSQTQASHRAAIQSLAGSIGKKFSELRNQIIELISILELELDFAENEIDKIPANELIKSISNILKINNNLLKSYSCGKILKQGVLVPIIGPPNSGKSSLLNAFLNEERAIVTPYPGTTRDSLEEAIQAGGYIIRLLDTAGIRKTKNPIEKIGIDRTKDNIQKGDIILFVVDATQPIQRAWTEYYSSKNTIVVINKIDIASQKSLTRYEKHFAPFPHIFVSAKKHQGIHKLTELIVDSIKKQVGASDSLIITNQRHATGLRTAKQYLLTTQKHLKQNLAPEILIADLRMALDEYDKILGKTSNEEILNNIFQHFCIGK